MTEGQAEGPKLSLTAVTEGPKQFDDDRIAHTNGPGLYVGLTQYSTLVHFWVRTPVHSLQGVARYYRYSFYFAVTAVLLGNTQ